MAKKEESASAPVRIDRNREAMDRIRDVAKWLIVVFGAIGGVLLTGTQLSDIGATADGDRTQAITGMILGVAGAGLALMATVRVLLPITISLKDLATGKSGSPVGDFVKEQWERLPHAHWHPPVEKFVGKDPTLLGDYGPKIDDFRKARDKRWRTLTTAREKFENGGRTWQLKKELVLAEEEVDRVDAVGASFLSFALATRVKGRMKGAVLAIFVGGAMVATGITMFSMATHDGGSAAAGGSAEAVPKRPSAVSVDLSEHGLDVLTKRIGDGCPANPLRAIALGGEPDALDLVSIPSADCAATRFTLTENMGVVTSDEEVELGAADAP
jgi:hypothetical protein